MPPPARRLEGRVALVTGASRGIGQAIATRLAREGADVAITVHREPGDRTLALLGALGVRALAVPADLGDPVAPSRAVAEAHAALGRLDILVNNAGGGAAIHPLLDVSAEEWDRTFAVNARGPFLALQAAARLMVAAGGGAIVNIASVAALGPRPTVAPYAAAKTAMLSYTRSAAAALARQGVRVNVVCPGLVETRIWHEFRREPAGEALFGERLREIAMGRAGTPEEIADAVAFLASDDARYVTGQTLSVCGGLAMP